jgi:hypothetical protein
VNVGAVLMGYNADDPLEITTGIEATQFVDVDEVSNGMTYLVNEEFDGSTVTTEGKENPVFSLTNLTKSKRTFDGAENTKFDFTAMDEFAVQVKFKYVEPMLT